MELAQYQQQNSLQTLREAMEEYFSINPGLHKLKPGEPGAELFLPHDACHIIFGLGTSIIEEAMADIWTLYGSDVGTRRYLGYIRYIAQLSPDSIVKQIGLETIAYHLVVGGPYMWKARKSAKRMLSTWPFDRYQEYYDKSLTKIRRSFGIEVLHIPKRYRRASSVHAQQ